MTAIATVSPADRRSVAGEPLAVVGVSGSTHAPSRTTALVHRIVEAIAERTPATTHVVEVDAVGPALAAARSRDAVPAEADEALTRIETADLLVVASPVYRASYTGLFKHLLEARCWDGRPHTNSLKSATALRSSSALKGSRQSLGERAMLVVDPVGSSSSDITYSCPFPASSRNFPAGQQKGPDVWFGLQHCLHYLSS